MRLVCALAVIAFHVFEGTVSSINIWGQVSYFMLTRISVPFFCLSSGFFFFNGTKHVRIEKLLHFEIRMIRRLLFWSLLFFPLKISEFLQNGTKISIKVFWFYMVSFLREGGYYHLWYMLGVILAVPIAMFVIRRIPFGMVFALSIGMILLGTSFDILLHFPMKNRIVNLFIDKYVLLFGNSTKNAILYCLPYVCIGGILSNTDNKKEGRNSLLVIATILYFIEVYLLTKYNIIHLNMFFFVSFTASLGFCFLLRMPSLEISTKRIRLMSEYIYFIHPMAIWLFRDMAGFKSYGLFICSALSSLLVAFVLSLFVGRKR